MQTSPNYSSMQTRIVEFDRFNPESPAWQSAVRLIQLGRVIVAPTDTVYGVMCRYDSASAVAHLYEIKQRSDHKAIPVLIGDYEQLPQVTGEPISDLIGGLMERFWPGPLTLVIPAHAALPIKLTAGGSTVGVRMPDHDALREFMHIVGPLAVTSANLSGDQESVTSTSAQEQLDGLVPLILSDDATVSRPEPPVPSTVIDLSNNTARIIRAGPIYQEVMDALNDMGVEIC